MNKTLISFNNITLTFGKEQILSGFNLSIKEGDKVLIKGPSGSGKSSLLKLLLGFQLPEKGEIFYERTLLDSSTIWEIRKQIAYVPQKLLLPQVTVEETITSPFNLKANQSLEPETEEIERWLEFFELDRGIIKKTGDQLSGGEAQRIALVKAILLKRSCYLLDEATSALDGRLKEKTATHFLSSSATVIALSHDPAWEAHKEMKVFNIKEATWEQ